MDFPRGITGFPPLRMEDCRQWEGGDEELRRCPEGRVTSYVGIFCDRPSTLFSHRCQHSGSAAGEHQRGGLGDQVYPFSYGSGTDVLKVKGLVQGHACVLCASLSPFWRSPPTAGLPAVQPRDSRVVGDTDLGLKRTACIFKHLLPRLAGCVFRKFTLSSGPQLLVL